jgi:hypothetical protein
MFGFKRVVNIEYKGVKFEIKNRSQKRENVTNLLVAISWLNRSVKVKSAQIIADHSS